MNSTFVVCFYVVKSCPVLVAPTNGKKDSNDTSCNSTVEFNCDACYELMGNSQLTCLPNQTWSGEEPNCNGQCNWDLCLNEFHICCLILRSEVLPCPCCTHQWNKGLY